MVTLAVYYFSLQLLGHGLTTRVDHFVAILGSATYGIYLAHVMVMDAIDHYGHFGIQYATHDLWLYYLTRIGLIFGFSYLLVVIIRFLRLHKLLLGEV